MLAGLVTSVFPDGPQSRGANTLASVEKSLQAGQWGAADPSAQRGPLEGPELVCELLCHQVWVTEILGSHRSGGENYRLSLEGSGDAPFVNDCVSV